LFSQDYTAPEFTDRLDKAGPFDLILDFSGGQNDSSYLPHLRKNCGSKYVSTSSPLLKAMDKKGILVRRNFSKQVFFLLGTKFLTRIQSFTPGCKVSHP
jgi:hypothetical protein